MIAEQKHMMATKWALFRPVIVGLTAGLASCGGDGDSRDIDAPKLLRAVAAAYGQLSSLSCDLTLQYNRVSGKKKETAAVSCQLSLLRVPASRLKSLASRDPNDRLSDTFVVTATSIKGGWADSVQIEFGRHVDKTGATIDYPAAFVLQGLDRQLQKKFSFTLTESDYFELCFMHLLMALSRERDPSFFPGGLLAWPPAYSKKWSATKNRSMVEVECRLGGPSPSPIEQFVITVDPRSGLVNRLAVKHIYGRDRDRDRDRDLETYEYIILFKNQRIH